MKFSILRSGSSGNCTFVEHKDTRLLIDAGGMSRKKLVEILNEIDVDPCSITAIINTHLHGDHLNRATLSFCRTFSVPLWIHQNNTEPFQQIFGGKPSKRVEVNSFDEKFAIGEIMFEAFEIPHDARGLTFGFKFYPSNGCSDLIVGYATDLGYAPEDLTEHLSNVKVLCLEANHDPALLWDNPNRTWNHKKRVTGARGHLSNLQSAQTIERIAKSSSSEIETVILCHLSEDHNTPDLALGEVKRFLKEQGINLDIFYAQRHQRTVFYHLDKPEDIQQTSFVDQLV
ncbi:MBL fold metallo-hydrolase [Chitinispirillales bacterium ANBcel5]|uniref:MBL fold metallo-hydrolase n=1 Tax=Cellulosispirillum alkaliphilum TaxID=3039283 RepID=UPI002A508FFD|nr:MBL fold metallo-hydrolase [Chitinispirillales bacterium ANBcel5]